MVSDTMGVTHMSEKEPHLLWKGSVAASYGETNHSLWA